jgi:hypothetical protein
MTLSLLLLAAAVQAPAEPAPVAVPGIADNSFLLEEAYNQEFGVVQHISAFMRVEGGDWAYTFTQEWPMPDERHQLSVTLPVQSLAEETGLGDLSLNYRYQAIGTPQTSLTFTPRVSLLLPTGASSRGLGTGKAGVQVNLPLSAKWGTRWVAHSNLGATWVPSARNAADEEADSSGLHAGQSLILAASPKIQPLVELLWTRTKFVAGPGRTETEDALLLSPGVRWAHDFRSGLQIVPGVAVPIGMGPSRGETGLFFYLSIEHPFRALEGDGSRAN